MSGFARVDRTLVWLSARQLFAKRRAWLALGLSLVPMLVALVFRLLVTDARGSSGDFLIGLARDLVIGALLPLTAVLFGTTAFGGDIEDGTLLYLLLKPVARWRVVLWKYVVAVACTAAVMIPAVLLPWLVVRGPDLPIQVPLSLLAGLGVGCALYCAGFRTRRVDAPRAGRRAVVCRRGRDGAVAKSHRREGDQCARVFARRLSAIARKQRQPGRQAGDHRYRVDDGDVDAGGRGRPDPLEGAAVRGGGAVVIR